MEKQTRLVAQRVRMIKAAVPLTPDERVITPRVCLVRALVAQLRAILQAIEGFDHAIAQLGPTHPDFALLYALPGAGPVSTPRLLVGFGEQRDRYTSATELQQYAAISPVTERSGETYWVHWRLQCPKFLRQTFVAWASESIRHSFWVRAYDAQQWAKGSTHQAARRALAFKWTRFLYGVVNLLPVDMINEHEGTRPPGSSRLCGGGKARDILPGVESFPHLLTICGAGSRWRRGRKCCAMGL